MCHLCVDKNVLGKRRESNKEETLSFEALKLLKDKASARNQKQTRVLGKR